MLADTVQRIVTDLMHEFVTCLRDRNRDGALRLFHSDAVLFGSEAGESAHGAHELSDFFDQLFERPQTYGWMWEPPIARRAGDVIWFVAPATVLVRGDDGSEHAAPYRLSGVLEQATPGRWMFRLFNGAEPAPDQPE
jgi:ketosteroid isomerase-like protein